MPELPEIHCLVQSLAPSVVGQTIQDVRILRRDILHPATIPLDRLLIGKRLVSLSRHAKRVHARFSDANQLFIHLGMSGALRVCSRDAPLARHTHAVIRFDSGESELRFVDPRRFGGLFWAGATPDLSNFGPDALLVDAKELAERLASSRRSIKAALLDQSVVAGIGNIYADESLHRARIHPLRRCCRLQDEEYRRLALAIRGVLAEAIRAGGSTIRDYFDATGSAGQFQKYHRVYGRQSKACRCGAVVQKTLCAGRSTFFCPDCQPRRPGSGVGRKNKVLT
jgi:formamidopyrimidine-DNA glycosylase